MKAAARTLLVWRTLIESVYGTLETFDDAHTIRIQLDQCDQWLRIDADIQNLLAGHDDVLLEWQDDHRFCQRAITELSTELFNWLVSKGLTP